MESELLYVKSLNNGLVKVTDYTDYQIANNRHARAITKELLVCRLCIILLCFYELMVEIIIIHLTLFQLARCKYTIEQ